MDIPYTMVIIGVVIVAAGWAAYGIWRYKEYKEEKKEPEKKTEHLDKVKRSFEEYTKKMKEYELKPYEHKKDKNEGT
jgi:heme/copper-type cytochrome/quinol oxidase subunit 2